MKCLNCNKEIKDNAHFCDQCGYPLDTETQSGYGQTENVEETATKQSLHEDMMIFVDKNQQYYEDKWQKSEAKNGVSFNFAALFLSFFWLGYRKMYMVIFYIAIFLLLTDVIMYLSGYEYNFDLVTDPIDRAIEIAVAIFLFLYGNKLYKNYVERNVSLIDHVKSGEQVEKLKRFKDKGGTSWSGPIFAALILIGVYGIPAQFIPLNVSAVDQVKFSYYDDPELTFGQVFENYFDEGEWIEQESNDAYAIVDHNGKKTIDGDTYDISIRFQDTDGGSLDILSVTIDGDMLDVYDSDDFVNYIFDENDAAYE